MLLIAAVQALGSCYTGIAFQTFCCSFNGS